MNTNKIFTDLSIKNICDKIKLHDKAINSVILTLDVNNWMPQVNGTFKNTITHTEFSSKDKMNVDLYDDGNLSDIQLEEYENYIDSFDVVNGGLVVTANTKPTQTFILVVKGDFTSRLNEGVADIENDLKNHEQQLTTLTQSVNNQNTRLTTCEQSLINYDERLTTCTSTLENHSTRIDECFQSVSDGKALVASAITDKGVATDATASFAQMSQNIANISTGGGEGGLPATIIAGDTPILCSSTLAYTCTSTSMTKTGISVTIPKNGTYRFKFSAGRTSTSGTWTAQLYKNGSAISSATATWSQYQGTYSGDIACNANDTIEIYARSRGTSYRAIISQLVACIDWDIN